MGRKRREGREGGGSEGRQAREGGMCGTHSGGGLFGHALAEAQINGMYIKVRIFVPLSHKRKTAGLT